MTWIILSASRSLHYCPGVRGLVAPRGRRVEDGTRSHGSALWTPSSLARSFFEGLGTMGPCFEGALGWWHNGFIRIQN